LAPGARYKLTFYGYEFKGKAIRMKETAFRNIGNCFKLFLCSWVYSFSYTVRFSKFKKNSIPTVIFDGKLEKNILKFWHII